jgi:Na+/phosphate symporter
MSNLKKKLNKTASNEDVYNNIKQIDRYNTTIYDGLENIGEILETSLETKAALSNNGIDANELFKKIDELSSYFDVLSTKLKDALDKIDY